MKKAILMIIRAYQRTISPDHGYGRYLMRDAGCRFSPTCSAYTYDAIVKYGVTKGLVLGVARIARCHPWSHGGHDPVK